MMCREMVPRERRDRSQFDRGMGGPIKPAAQDRLPVDTATSPDLGETGSGLQTRSRSMATVMSPRTLDVVRQRSRNQSTVSRIGIFSAGRRTAAKMRGSVTKLPEGKPPAPNAAHDFGWLALGVVVW